MPASHQWYGSPGCPNVCPNQKPRHTWVKCSQDWARPRPHAPSFSSQGCPHEPSVTQGSTLTRTLMLGLIFYYHHPEILTFIFQFIFSKWGPWDNRTHTQVDIPNMHVLFLAAPLTCSNRNDPLHTIQMDPWWVGLQQDPKPVTSMTE